MRREGRTALETVGSEFTGVGGGGPADAEPLTELPAVGDTVFVTTFGVDGIVRGVAGHKVEVEIRGKRMRVGLGDLRRASAGRGKASGVQPSVPRSGVCVRGRASRVC